MDPDHKDELAALVVSFLQQSYKDTPEGFTIRDFERLFPERVGEEKDWYKNYGCKNILHALENIQEHVFVKPNSRGTMVSLNLKSNKIDKDLLALIVGQKSTGKKRRPTYNRPSRAVASFSLNRQYSSSKPKNSWNSQFSTSRRLNQDHRADSYMIKRAPEPVRPSVYSNNNYSSNNSSSIRPAAPYDPRAASRISNSSPITGNLSQPRYPTATPPPKPYSGSQQPQQNNFQSPQPPKPQPPFQSQQQQQQQQPQQQQQQQQPLKTPPKLANGASVQQQPLPLGSEPIFRRKDRDNSSSKASSEISEDPKLTQKKSYLRQRLVFLLTKKHAEIKIVHLKDLYKIEFDETLNQENYGYKSIHELLKDPSISPSIKVNAKAPHMTISIRDRTALDGKENLNSELNGWANNNATINCNELTKSQAKVDAIEPFNLKNMLNTLEPLSELTKPGPMYSKIDDKINDIVKYKTIRIVFTSPNGTLPLEEWEARYEQESRLRLRVREFGFKTSLEFFKSLAKETPLKISLNANDEWIAIIDMVSLMDWVNQELSQGHYKAIMAMDSLYEIVALPNDLYTYKNVDELINICCPVSILSAKRSSSMWIQIREAKKIEEHLSIEASMTCYEDYKNKGLLSAPKWFIHTGFPCAVYDPSQQRWCRGLILKAPNSIDKNYEVEVLLVDYAITRTVPVSDILCLLKNHLRRPVGPIHCRLLNVNDKELTIRTRAKMILQEYTNPPVTLACKFVRKVPQEDQTNQASKYLPRDSAEVCLIDTRREDLILAELITSNDGDSPI